MYDLGDVPAAVGPISVSFEVTVNEHLPTDATAIINLAAIEADNSCSHNAIDQDSLDGFDAALRIDSIDDGLTTAVSGDTLTYTIQYSNGGTRASTQVMLSVAVPDHATPVASARWTCRRRIGSPSISSSSLSRPRMRVEAPPAGIRITTSFMAPD